jgi:serine/threonine protein kinase
MSIIKISGSKGVYTFDPEISFLREGKFSAIYVGVDDNNCKVLIKQLHSDADVHEYSLQFNHPSFVAYTDSCLVNNVTFLIRPFIEGDSLWALSKSGLLRKKGDRTLLINIIRQVGEALNSLHESGLIHGDVRPHNILVAHQNENISEDASIKIIDLAMMRKSGTVPLQPGFALIYSPPELVLKKYDLTGPASDQYSLAISIYEILSGAIPFKHINPELLTHLMLVQPLKEVSGIDKSTLVVLQKASARYPFKSPPKNLQDAELSSQLQQAINERYTSVKEFCEELIATLVNEKKSFFSFFRS